MLLSLPAAAYLLLLLLMREKRLDWRRAALAAAVLWGTCVALSTETLSAVRLISRGPLAIFWLTVCVAGLLYLRVLRRRNSRIPRTSSAEAGEALTSGMKRLLALAGIAVLLVGIDALVAPPSTWDAMLYHLPRVVMWISNHNVRFFPTPDLNQLIFGPWAEYAMLHTWLLWGSDRFVNFVEFLSLVGSAIGVSLVAQRLGAGPGGQALAAIISATIPAGLLEGSGAMNTYVVSFWIVATAVFLFDWNEDPGWLNTVCVGFSAGLAILTKGTALVYLPAIVIACWLMAPASRRILFVKRGAAFLAAILAINGPQFVRCYEFAGTPLGLPLPFRYPRVEVTMAHISIRGTLAAILRNVSLHFGTFSDSANSLVEHMFRLAFRAIGANPDDPGAIWLGDKFHINRFSLHEIYAGNPLHLFLLLASVTVIALKWREAGLRKAFWYALAVIAGFVCLCATLLWNMWAGRLQLPFFVLGAALIGFTLERYAPPKVATYAGILVIAWALPYAAMNRIRSLIPVGHSDNIYHPRPEMYFYDQHEPLIPVALAATDAINRSGCGTIGIDAYSPKFDVGHSPRSFYVYPFLALIHVDGQTRTVRYTGVHNPTSRYATERDRAAPCAVICLDCADVRQKWDEYRAIGGRASVFDYIVVFSSNGSVENLPQPGAEEKRLPESQSASARLGASGQDLRSRGEGWSGTQDY
jgi:hypothetical protein